MREWILGLLIALGVVFVLALVIYVGNNTLRHGSRDAMKRNFNTYFIQYISLISAAAAMYDLVVVACTVRKTDTERIDGEKHVCVHSGRLGRCISDFSLAVLLSTYFAVAIVMVITGRKPFSDLGHVNPRETTVFGSLKYCRDALRMRRTKQFKFAMIFLTLAITVNIVWLAYFIFQKDSEALPSFLVTALAIYLLLKSHIILQDDGDDIYDVRKYNNIGQIQIMQPLELTIPGRGESGLVIPGTDVLASADAAEDLFNEATLKIVAAGDDSEKLDHECHKLMKKIIGNENWPPEDVLYQGPEGVLYQWGDPNAENINNCPNFDRDDKYKTIWENHIKLLVADLRSGKAAKEYHEPKPAGFQ